MTTTSLRPHERRVHATYGLQPVQFPSYQWRHRVTHADG